MIFNALSDCTKAARSKATAVQERLALRRGKVAFLGLKFAMVKGQAMPRPYEHSESRSFAVLHAVASIPPHGFVLS